jgi:hypothetical protein
MFKAGQQVIWSHQPHGGYGYLIDVPAVVVSVTAKRVRIAAQRQNQPPKLVSVRPANLRRRSS